MSPQLTQNVAHNSAHSPGISDFHGGVHPPENKQQSLGQPIEILAIPAELVFPCSQHIGAPATPIVKIGERVLKGQKIAAAAGPVSVPVHASSSGTVTAIEHRPIAHPSGMDDLCIVISTDGKDEWTRHEPFPRETLANRKELLERIQEAGIAGMGGAGFPSSIKLDTHPDKNIDTLIINGTECEPYITADHALMRERAHEIISGIEILASIIQPERIIIGIEDNKPDGIQAIRDAAEKYGEPIPIETVVFPTKYPSGGEKQLIQILTGLEVPSGGLPADIGIVCQNMGTAVAIEKAVRSGEPLVSRITTVTGDAVGKPGNYEVLLGTPIEFLLSETQLDENRLSRLIMGGPMMGFAITNTQIPVVKSTNCVLAPTAEELPLPPPAQACIRCGLCAEACPVSLLPQQLYWFAQGKELEKLQAHNIADCIECGACSYVCPSNIPLVQYYRASKAEIRQREIDHKNAEHSKVRFEARQQRLQQQEEEKQAARKARQAAARAAAEKKAAAAEKAANEDNTKDTGETRIIDGKEKVGDPEAKAAEIQAALARVQAKKEAASAAEADDPIARAKAKRALQQAGDTASPEEKLAKAVESTAQRLEKAKAKLANAEAEGDANVDAFRTAVEKTTAKHDAAVAALDELRKPGE